MNTEALRLLDALNDAVGQYADAIRNDKRNGMTGVAAAKVDLYVDQLRALLSAQEPTAEHWRQAIRDWYGTTRAVGLAWDWIEQRARELAKQEAK